MAKPEDIIFILFDCMETIVDITGFSEPGDYAYSAFKGSGIEFLWNDYDEFYRKYLQSRQIFDEYYQEHQEYEFATLYTYICESNDRITEENIMNAVYCLLNNYWSNYLSGCSISDSTINTIKQLHRNHKLGIISNFKVAGGIESLLERHGIDRYFEFILTSATFGWRKPHESIYRAALEKTGLPPEQHLFVGDDIEHDYRQPLKMGMKAVLFDKNKAHPDITESIASLEELQELDLL